MALDFKYDWNFFVVDYRLYYFSQNYISQIILVSEALAIGLYYNASFHQFMNLSHISNNFISNYLV